VHSSSKNDRNQDMDVLGSFGLCACGSDGAPYCWVGINSCDLGAMRWLKTLILLFPSSSLFYIGWGIPWPTFGGRHDPILGCWHFGSVWLQSLKSVVFLQCCLGSPGSQGSSVTLRFCLVTTSSSLFPTLARPANLSTAPVSCHGLPACLAGLAQYDLRESLFPY
jgi:hypothetical protein